MTATGPADRPKTFSQYRDVPEGTCLRCGGELPERDYVYLDDGGRPRQWCSDACRRAASRLRKTRGGDWWRQQPWYGPWAAARQDWLDRKSAEQELRESMPPQVRQGFDRAKLQTGTLVLELQTAITNLERRHRKHLAEMGAEVRLITGPERKIDRLMRLAVVTENEAEAQAYFEGARKLAAGGDRPDTAESLMAEANSILREVLDTGAWWH